MDSISQLIPYKGMKSTLNIKGGGIESKVTQTTNSGFFSSPVIDRHRYNIRNTLIHKALPEAKQHLRENAIKEAKQIAEEGNKRGKEAAAKRDLQIRQENSKLRNEFENRVKEYKVGKKKAAESKAAELKESIAKHEAKAAELRAKKKLAKNLKTAGKIGLGVAGAAGLGYGIKKAIDKKKKDKNYENKKNK